MALADMRKDYGLAGLLEEDLARNPFCQFEKWFQEAEAYFLSRPRASQLAVSASPQSTAGAGRAVLEESHRMVEKKFAGRPVPVPPNWGGFRLAPETVEFWPGRRSRLHDQRCYRRETGGDWVVERLAP
jgi:pyridoxamine 5'-phosphate oxidase